MSITKTTLEKTAADLQAKIKQARKNGEYTDDLMIKLDALIDQILLLSICTCSKKPAVRSNSGRKEGDK